LSFDPGRVVPYDLNSGIQHDPETIRMVGMVTELMSLLLDEALESALIHTEMVFLREPARCDFEREVVRLEGRLSVDPTWGLLERLTQDEAIQDVCSGVCAYSKSKA
jgi:hypothetical protein